MAVLSSRREGGEIPPLAQAHPGHDLEVPPRGRITSASPSLRYWLCLQLLPSFAGRWELALSGFRADQWAAPTGTQIP